MEGLRFRVLGPTEVRQGGEVVALPARRLRALLTELLIQANRVVPPAELIEALWSGEPPAGPERALHTSVSRLRAALGPIGALIRTVPGGYLIELETDQLDLSEFRALAEAAATEADPQQRVALLAKALDLWQDVPLTGLGSESLENRPWLTEERLQAIEHLVDARLAVGDHSVVVADLTGLTREHPLRERFWSQLMLALYRGGRQADALAAYRRLSGVLAEELGVDPGTEARQLHQAILTGDVPTQAQPSDQPTDDWDRHSQLPMDLSDFVGRDEVIGEISDRLSESSAMPVVVISGAPGVGKSALAVHLGHQLRARFPDGQWHVRLAGAGNSPRDPLDVLAELLNLAGVDPSELPADLERRAALLRSTLADRQVLLLLDDARDARQVKPLLPGTAGNAVLVTSRNELAGLSVTVGARGTRLAMLDPAEAVDLLAGMLGAERIAAEPDEAAELAEVCDRLPLALRIAAGLLSGRPDQSIAGYVEELRAGDRLAGLAIGDEPDTAVAAAFGLSYEALVPQARRLFALLGLVPGGDVSVPGAAALYGGSPREVGPLLETLAGVNLLQRDRSRYRMHDLIRLYAAGRAELEPGADEAWHRFADWYLRTADAACSFGYRPLVRLTERIYDENPFADGSQAAAWLLAEEQNLASCVTRAAEIGPYGVAWRLADVLRQYFSRDDRVGPWRQAATAGLRAALAAGDLAGEGAMRHSLGALAFTVGDPEVAIEQASKACECYAEAGFKLGEAALLCNVGMAYDDKGESVQAVEFLMRGIQAFRDLGQIGALWPALHSLSNVSHNLGDLDEAVAAASEALAIAPDGYAGVVGRLNRGAAYRLMGETEFAEADMTTALAMEERQSAPGQYEIALLYVDLGRYDEAAAYAEVALSISRRDGLEFHETMALNTLGIIDRGRGQWDEAAKHHADARDIAVRLGQQAAEAEALLGLGSVALNRKDLAEAFELGGRARELAGELRQRIVECRAVFLLAETSRQAGRSADAEQLMAEAAAIQAATGYRPPTRRGN